MIMAHEQQHIRRHHSADKLLMLLVQSLFWFHPLVYAFGKRLTLVHEFQADTIASGQTADYGKFLLEQMVMQSAPLPAHSFNYSPIKNRILMITRTSSPESRTVKYLLGIPMLLIFALCFTRSAHSQEARFRKGNIVTFKGNEFELSAPKEAFAIKEKGKTEKMQIRIEPYPIKMNGQKIYKDNNVQPVYKGPGGDLSKYAYEKLAEDLKQLEDGMYGVTVFNLIVDENGKVVYYDFPGIRRSSSYPGGSGAPISDDIKKSIDKKVYAILEGRPEFAPATAEGKPVISVADMSVRVVVKNHELTII
jgi:hypothetical protein